MFSLKPIELPEINKVAPEQYDRIAKAFIGCDQKTIKCPTVEVARVPLLDTRKGGTMTEAEQDFSSTSPVPSPHRPDPQEYRLDFTEVTGDLEAVPEEGKLTCVVASAAKEDDPLMIKPFESNASDVHSECSTVADSSVYSATNRSRKGEVLTARQQVALWLTRTSNTDLGSMPSLRSLFTGISSSGSRPKKNKSMRRNFSTKSLMGFGSGSNKEPEMMNPSPIRKCETVIALSRIPSQQRQRSTTKASSSAGLFRKLSSSSRCGGVTSPFGGGAKGVRAVHSDAYLQHGIESPFQGMRPINRLRSRSSILCSRCTSALSMASLSRVTSRDGSRCTSQISIDAKKTDEPEVLCKICLVDYTTKDMFKLQECGCMFCKECLNQYVSFEIMEGSYDISCPDPLCEKQGLITMDERERLTSSHIMERHRVYRLNTEVSLDTSRAFCPRAGCDTICHICSSSSLPATDKKRYTGVAVQCPTCCKEFCSLCSATWHEGLTCEEYGAQLVRRGMTEGSEIFLDNFGDDIKKCPVCHIPIERDAGCAQMMCKRCKHVFCWYCLESLDDDFLLRHYDAGLCKGKLGHSRTSVLWHRAQVIGIFAGFAILLLIASPLLLIAAPCVYLCRCKTCQKLNEEEAKSASSDAVHM